MKTVWFFLLVPLLLWGAEPSEPAVTPAEPEPAVTPDYFTPDEVSGAGARLQNALAEINASLTPSASVVETETSLPAYIDSLKAMRKDDEPSSLEAHSIKRLAHMSEQAKLYKSELKKYEETLQAQVDTHNRVIERLKGLNTRWNATLENAKSEKAPDAIVERITSSLALIATTRDTAKHSYDKVLTYTDMVVEEDRQISLYIDTLDKTRAQLESRLFVKDSDPLFTALSEHSLRPSAFIDAVGESFREIYRTSTLFYRGNMDRVYLHVFLTLLVLATMLFLYIKERRGTLFVKRDDKVRSSLFFVQSPLAATVILSILMIAATYPERPYSVTYVNMLIASGALLAIIYKIADIRLFRFALLLVALFALGGLLKMMIGFELEIRLLWCVESLVMLAALATLLRPGSFIYSFTLGRWQLFLIKLGMVALFLLAVGLIANLVGWYHLAQKLTYATLISLTLYMAFSIVARVLGGMIVMFVRRRSLASKHLLDAYADQITGHLTFITNAFLMLYWIYLVLKQFEISGFLQKQFTAMMTLSWQVGSVTLSLGALIDFAVLLAVTIFLTRFIQILLDLELFSRYELPRGIPAAIQMLIRYLIITIGVLLALSSLGINMSDLSLIAGALGVGIGFGLRNIMANFVSGILMVFERPVQLGDVVEVDRIFGDVQRIGVRATTIKTYDGSEVIVPNADFITKEVTNWTLSSKLRRVKMAYKVAFGNNPRDVITIIQQVIAAHPDIKEEPAPKVLFEGYGDYYLEFMVYFWVEERLLDVKSETAIAIYEALNEAGIAMPVPLQDVRYTPTPPHSSSEDSASTR